jgi:hypothetical protein
MAAEQELARVQRTVQDGWQPLRSWNIGCQETVPGEFDSEPPAKRVSVQFSHLHTAAEQDPVFAAGDDDNAGHEPSCLLPLPPIVRPSAHRQLTGALCPRPSLPSTPPPSPTALRLHPLLISVSRSASTLCWCSSPAEARSTTPIARRPADAALRKQVLGSISSSSSSSRRAICEWFALLPAAALFHRSRRSRLSCIAHL